MMPARSLGAVLLTACLVAVPDAGGLRASESVGEAEAARLAEEAYIYGYPLVTMEMTRRVMTNVAAPDGTHAPMGGFVRMRTYPDAKFRDVTAPNADTLYSAAWLDLAKEPYILSLPDMGDRYFLMPMLSGWTDVFAVPGKRTTGSKAQAYAITGPGWDGPLPDGVTQLKSPTNLVWILGRTYCTGTPRDYEEVHALMDRYALAPLSAYGKAYSPPAGSVDPGIDTKTAVRDQVHALGAEAFFALMAKLMKDNPPAQADAPLVARIARIGIVPGQPFELAKLDPAAAGAVSRAPKAAVAKILGHMKDSGELVNGWTFTTRTGLYGTDYLQRAFVAAIGLGANRPQDAVYPTSIVDAEGARYHGSGKYVLHFAPGQMPPADGFWSLTMYDAAYFFVDNPLNKYTVSPRNDLKYNDDGSLDIHIQKDSPGKDREANWLPAPPGDFILMMRLYWPRESAPSILDGSWTIPGVRLVK